jgi:hypothetical protein
LFPDYFPTSHILFLSADVGVNEGEEDVEDAEDDMPSSDEDSDTSDDDSDVDEETLARGKDAKDEKKGNKNWK